MRKPDYQVISNIPLTVYQSFFLSHYGLSQDIEYSSLCYTVGFVVYFTYSSVYLLIPNSQFIPPLPQQPQACSLCLWVCFYFVNKFICVIFLNFLFVFIFLQINFQTFSQLKKNYLFIYLLTYFWLHRVLVAACRIFSCSVRALPCSAWASL